MADMKIILVTKSTAIAFFLQISFYFVKEREILGILEIEDCPEKNMIFANIFDSIGHEIKLLY